MSVCVLDASLGLTWFFGDRATRATDAVLKEVLAAACTVPAIWPWKVSSVLLKSARRIRMPAINSARELRLLTILIARKTVLIDPPGDDGFEPGVALALTHQLSSYDAAYLELALRLRLPLATLDQALLRAAAAEGVPVLPEPV